VLQIKASLIALGLANAATVAIWGGAAIAACPPGAPLPRAIRLTAALSLIVWLSVAACGRLIAYF
jgi:hypothetical protein